MTPMKLGRFVPWPLQRSIWRILGGFCWITSLIRLARVKRIDMEERDWGRVLVVGRGVSLEQAASLGTDFDVAILCNFNDTEVLHSAVNPWLRALKAILLLSNVVELRPSCRVLRSLPLGGVAWVGFLDGRKPHRKRLSGRLSGAGMRVQGLPTDFNESWLERGAVKNTGIVAMRLAALRSVDVSIVGLDFYKANHLNPTEPDLAADGYRDLEYGDDMLHVFLTVVRSNPEVTFRVLTEISIPGSAQNLVLTEGA